MSRIVITSTFTADPIEEPLRFLLTESGINSEVLMTPYNQLAQYLADPHSPLRSNLNGINILLLGPSAESYDTQNIIDMLSSIIQESKATWLLVNCPKEMLSCHYFQIDEIYFSNLLILQAPSLKNRDNQSSFNQTGIPYDKSYFYELSISLSRAIYRIKSIQKKIIILDADNTLWPGICAEAGPKNIKLTPEFFAFQSFLLEKYNNGFLLALCSKNIAADVEQTFATHPEWPLQWKHFVATRINWDDKASGIQSIAEELSLGLDSFVFLDDNPVECAAVRAMLPEVTTIQVPKYGLENWFTNLWVLDQQQVTETDRQRNLQYMQESERKKFRSTITDLHTFLEQLEMKIQIEPLSATALPRAAQLSVRTNQFNTTALRLTETELRALLSDEHHFIFTVSVQDRFGDYGMVGLMSHQLTPPALRTRLFLLSCRVLGREVERRMLEHAFGLAQTQNVERLEIEFKPSVRNEPARLFLQSSGFTTYENGFFWNTNHPLPKPKKIETSEKKSQSTLRTDLSPAGKEPDFNRLAQLSSVDFLEKTLANLHAHKRPELSTPYITPSNNLERMIAKAWIHALNLDRAGIADNFFDLGGESLHLVEVHRQLVQDFPSLQIVELFQYPTISALAEHLSGKSAYSESTVTQIQQRAALQRAAFAKARKPQR